MLGLDLRDGVDGLARYAAADLMALWAGLDESTARAALLDTLPALIGTYGLAAAALAADWYDGHREAAGVGGSFTAVVADIPDVGAHPLIGWAAQLATDMPAFQSLILGGTQRRIANFSRQTITGSSIADPHARGWRRVGSGRCDFCKMLIGRGAVYTEATAHFASHDHCHCSAVPEFG